MRTVSHPEELARADTICRDLHHICSISLDDEREEVVARLAVVRRDRFAVTDPRRGGPPGA